MKTVYILGAGFSIGCGAPPQSKILEKVLSLNSLNLKAQQKKKITALLASFKKFCDENLFVDSTGLSGVALEDIFTPLDRCIHDNVSFRDIEPSKLLEIRGEIYTLISAAISRSIDKPHEDFIKKFVDHIVKLASDRVNKPEEDYVSVISTNWDIILDNAVQDKLNSLRKPNEDFEGVVDYCCYMSSLKDDKKIKPGLLALGRGKFNVKLLKLHGSMNWLICPRCQRLYVDYYKNFQGVYLIKKHFCKHCTKNFQPISKSSITLRPNLIMPTFLKDLNNFQVKLIWQNAGIELSEATKIVFIGYSLPYADFEFRQLLSRMVNKNIEIRAVLSPFDEPVNGFEHYSAGYRYKTFFAGIRNLEVTYEGAREYILKEL